MPMDICMMHVDGWIEVWVRAWMDEMGRKRMMLSLSLLLSSSLSSSGGSADKGNGLPEDAPAVHAT
jgi:hypothetical protein